MLRDLLQQRITELVRNWHDELREVLTNLIFNAVGERTNPLKSGNPARPQRSPLGIVPAIVLLAVGRGDRQVRRGRRS